MVTTFHYDLAAFHHESYLLENCDADNRPAVTVMMLAKRPVGWLYVNLESFAIKSSHDRDQKKVARRAIIPITVATSPC